MPSWPGIWMSSSTSVARGCRAATASACVASAASPATSHARLGAVAHQRGAGAGAPAARRRRSARASGARSVTAGGHPRTRSQRHHHATRWNWPSRAPASRTARRTSCSRRRRSRTFGQRDAVPGRRVGAPAAALLSIDHHRRRALAHGADADHAAGRATARRRGARRSRPAAAAAAAARAPRRPRRRAPSSRAAGRRSAPARCRGSAAPAPISSASVTDAPRFGQRHAEQLGQVFQHAPRPGPGRSAPARSRCSAC